MNKIDDAVRRLRQKAQTVDYRYMTEMPIRDMWNDGKIAFVVMVYGVQAKDLCVIPGGSRPMMKAVERLGLDPNRYQAMLWDVQL